MTTQESCTLCHNTCTLQEIERESKYVGATKIQPANHPTRLQRPGRGGVGRSGRGATDRGRSPYPPV
ncbi:hypothetical protein Hanom_Chr13g01236281 [Helianthus anomalus]